jgi:uncharacterized protein (DUF697 family)
MRLPVDIRDIMASGTKLTDERARPVRIAVFVDVDAPDALVNAIQETLRPQTGSARLHVEVVGPGETLIVDPATDAVVALCGLGTNLTESLVRAKEAGVPTAVLALGQQTDDVSRRFSHPLLDTITAEEPEALVPRLGSWLTDRVSGKRIALAANFAFMRKAVAEESVKATSFQNGVIGGVMIIPGADMPIMTANQAKMVLQIAAAYGEPLGAERIRELAVVLGGAFALRAVARQALAFIPGFGWAIKAAIGYSGTLAMGYAAIEYFESGADLSGLANKLKDARDTAVEAARSRRLPQAEDDAPIPAHAYVVVEHTDGQVSDS